MLCLGTEKSSHRNEITIMQQGDEYVRTPAVWFGPVCVHQKSHNLWKWRDSKLYYNNYMIN